MTISHHRGNATPTRAGGHRGRQRGAVIVEAAIGLPLMVLLAFGIITFGQAYSNATIIAGSTRAGARLASATYTTAADTGTGPAQANTIAAAVATDLGNLKNATPVEMWLYKADANGYSNGDSTFTTCSTNCIKWTWNTTTGAWNSSTGTWASPQGCGSTLDYTGVYVKATDKLSTGLFGNQTITMKQSTTMRVEPVSDVLC